MKFHKNKSITVRLTQEEVDIVDFLINHQQNSRSEVIRHLINSNDNGIEI